MKTLRRILLVAWAIGCAVFAAEGVAAARQRDLQARQEAIAAKQQQLLEASEALLRQLDEFARATETWLRLEHAHRGWLSPRESAVRAAEELRAQLSLDERRETARRIAAQARADVDAQRPNRGGVITFGEKVIVVPPRPDGNER